MNTETRNAQMATLVEHVKAHAIANYTTGGWDYVVECWEDSQIIEAICMAGAKSEHDAIRAVAKLAGILADYRDDIRAAGDTDAERAEYEYERDERNWQDWQNGL